MDAEYVYIIYHNSLKFFCLSKEQKSVLDLINQTLLFLSMKGILSNIIKKIESEKLRHEMMFLTHIFKKLTECYIVLKVIEFTSNCEACKIIKIKTRSIYKAGKMS